MEGGKRVVRFICDWQSSLSWLWHLATWRRFQMFSTMLHQQNTEAALLGVFHFRFKVWDHKEDRKVGICSTKLLQCA